MPDPTVTHSPLIGGSPAMRRVRRLLERLGPTPLPKLVDGETGTGKELVARELHRVSGLDPYVAVNAAAIPEGLVEAELFGHARGAFTGAEQSREGLLEHADGGTMFLDEITEMGSHLQAKLLRVLDCGEFRRVGETRTRSVHFTLVAATNQNPEHAVAEGTLREDLYWRLKGARIHLAALRDRPGDIPLLAKHYAGGQPLSPRALEALEAYPWPGNVRELRHAIEYACTFTTPGQAIRPEHLPQDVRTNAPVSFRETPSEFTADGTLPTVAEVVRQHTLFVLQECHDDKKRAAKILGISARTLRRWLNKYEKEGYVLAGPGPP